MLSKAGFTVTMPVLAEAKSTLSTVPLPIVTFVVRVVEEPICILAVAGKRSTVQDGVGVGVGVGVGPPPVGVGVAPPGPQQPKVVGVLDSLQLAPLQRQPSNVPVQLHWPGPVLLQATSASRTTHFPI